jgi:hypothetical protein
MSDDNPKPSALDDLPTPGLFGEEAITAEILAMLCKHYGKGEVSWTAAASRSPPTS